MKPDHAAADSTRPQQHCQHMHTGFFFLPCLSTYRWIRRQPLGRCRQWHLELRNPAESADRGGRSYVADGMSRNLNLTRVGLLHMHAASRQKTKAWGSRQAGNMHACHRLLCNSSPRLKTLGSVRLKTGAGKKSTHG